MLTHKIYRKGINVILEALIEKKNLFIYIDQRIIRLWVAGREIGSLLQDPTVSPKRKKALMRGQMKLRGRHTELRRLRSILSEGRLKSESKRMWAQNFKEGLVEVRGSTPSERNQDE